MFLHGNEMNTISNFFHCVLKLHFLRPRNQKASLLWHFLHEGSKGQELYLVMYLETTVEDNYMCIYIYI